MIKKIIAKIKSIFTSSPKVEEVEEGCEHKSYSKRLAQFCLACGEHIKGS
jgi:hypothetical protein